MQGARGWPAETAHRLFVDCLGGQHPEPGWAVSGV